MLHSIAFAVVLSVTAYVIIDLEYPRLGFIQVSEYRARICIKLYDRALDFAGGEALI